MSKLLGEKKQEAKGKRKKLGLDTVKTAVEKGKSTKDKLDSKVSMSEADYASFEVADLMYSLLTGPAESIGNLLHCIIKEPDKVGIAKMAGILAGVIAVVDILISLLTLRSDGLFLTFGCLLAWSLVFSSCVTAKAKSVDDLLSCEDEFDDDEIL